VLATITLEGLRNSLTAEILHQPDAVENVATRVFAKWKGAQTQRPLVLLLAGPSGVGKTSLGQALVKTLWGKAVYDIPEQRAVVYKRISVTDFVSEHSVSTLLGANPGLVSSDEAGAC